MLIAFWIAMGLVAGAIANMVRGRRASGLGVDVVFGIAGAAFAGFAFDRASGPTHGVNPWTLVVSALGAALAVRISSGIESSANARKALRHAPRKVKGARR